MPTRILIIDDNPIILDTYREILSLENYVCIPHTTPFISVDEVAQLAPDLIIMDWFFDTTDPASPSWPTIELVTSLGQSPATAHFPILVCSAAGPLLHAYDDWFAEQGTSL